MGSKKKEPVDEVKERNFARIDLSSSYHVMMLLRILAFKFQIRNKK